MFVCVENKRIISYSAYEPNVPDTVEVYTINLDDYKKLIKGSHYFDLDTKSVKSVKKSTYEKELSIRDALTLLKNTDWLVLRHIREKVLNLETSLTEKQYLQLEKKRHEAAKSI